MSIADDLNQAITETTELLPQLRQFAPTLTKLGDTLLNCWNNNKKLMTCGNGGSCADAVHFAEELSVRFQKNRKALAAISLTDGSAITCAGNDFGFDSIFSRQVEALGQPGDVLCVFTTSGNSQNMIAAVQAATSRGVVTVAFLGKGGGKLKGVCDIELVVPSDSTARIQEAHQLFYHVLCAYIDRHVD
jgi:D-sedoheptulose 7-phosphate isomerase